MQISVNWLKNYLSLPASTDWRELALELSLKTVEVEKVSFQAEQFKNMVIGEIISLVDHPQADRLKVCEVSDGEKKYQVVCGGTNIYKGMKSVLALPGAKVVWHGQGEPVVLEATKIRGIESFGMLCAPAEIGVNSTLCPVEIPATGVLDLPHAKAGQMIEDALGVNDIILEIDNKSMTHRPDLWGHYGLAREIAVITDTALKPLPTSKAKSNLGVSPVKVEVKDKIACPRYIALTVKDIVIKDSPLWLKRLLLSAGMRPINNIVDLTNYIMLELGQPIHAFDRSTVKGDSLIIKRAEDKERFKTLDGEERILDNNTLLICDAEKAVALAGVMGGENSEIKETTTDVIFEIANFHPTIVRKAAQRLNLRTEASSRYEKSLDPALTLITAERILFLLKELSPTAKMVGSLVDVDNSVKTKITLDLDLSWLQKRLGEEISASSADKILTKLGFTVKTSAKMLKVTVPSFRASKDVTIVEDLVEEVARIYGYDKIVAKAPLVELLPPLDNPSLTLERKIKDFLSLSGNATEIVSYSFASLNAIEAVGFATDDHLEVLNPLTVDQKYLRYSLAESLFGNWQANSRFFDTLNIYEIGRAFAKVDGTIMADTTNQTALPKQDRFVAGLLTGKTAQDLFLNAKGLVESLLDYLEVDYVYDLESKKELPTATDNYLTIKVGGVVLGFIAGLDKNVAKKLDVKNEAVYWQLSFELLLKHIQDKKQYLSLPKYPGMIYDLSLFFPNNVTWAEVMSLVKSVSPLISRVELFDVYQEKTGKLRRSLAFHIYFLDPEKTLVTATVENIREQIINLLKTKLQAETRA
jgi:phenylalanyl-tRNA synthetase beta chain